MKSKMHYEVWSGNEMFGQNLDEDSARILAAQVPGDPRVYDSRGYDVTIKMMGDPILEEQEHNYNTMIGESLRRP